MSRVGRNHRVCNQYSMACIFNTVSLDPTARLTDSFEGRGAYSMGLLEDFPHTVQENTEREASFTYKAHEPLSESPEVARRLPFGPKNKPREHLWRRRGMPKKHPSYIQSHFSAKRDGNLR